MASTTTTCDFYHVLGVDANASQDTIKRAYRRLIKAYHPDRNTDKEEALRKTLALNEAYAVLKDPVRRREYDDLKVVEFLKQYQTPNQRVSFSTRFFRLYRAWFNVALIGLMLMWFFPAVISPGRGSGRYYSRQFTEESRAATLSYAEPELATIAGRYPISIDLIEAMRTECINSMNEVATYIRREAPAIGAVDRGNRLMSLSRFSRESLNPDEIGRHADTIEPLLGMARPLLKKKSSLQKADSDDRKAQALTDYPEAPLTLLASSYFNARLLQLSIVNARRTGEISRYLADEVFQVGRDPVVARWLASSPYAAAYDKLKQSLGTYVRSQDRLKYFEIELQSLENDITTMEKRGAEFERQLKVLGTSRETEDCARVLSKLDNLLPVVEKRKEQYDVLSNDFNRFMAATYPGEIDFSGAFDACLDPTVLRLQFDTWSSK